MDKFDLNIEIDNHISYYKLLINGSESIGKEIESKVRSIIDKKEKEGNLDKDDFVFIDTKNINLNIIQTDIIKVISRIKLLYQISFGINVEISLSDKDRKILDSILNGGGDFVFRNVNELPYFIDEYLSDTILMNSHEKFSKADIQVMYDELKKQFDFYESMGKEVLNGGKETNDK